MSSRSSITSMMPGPVTLPDDLEQVLTVIASGILEGHLKLITALRKRYDEQFPLVRNLADVFTTHVSCFKMMADYSPISFAAMPHTSFTWNAHSRK